MFTLMDYIYASVVHIVFVFLKRILTNVHLFYIYFFLLIGAAEFTTLRPSSWVVDAVAVEGNAADGYDITLGSVNCAGDLELISVYGKTVSIC